MSCRKELWMKRTSQRVTHSLTSELHEKLLTATNEIISLASSKKCSNAISRFEQLQTQTPYLSCIAFFVCVLAKKAKKNARSLPFFSVRCAGPKSLHKKNVTSSNAKKCASSPFFLISVRCAVLKDPPQKKCDILKCKKTRALSFFSSYQYVVQFEKTRQKEWRASLFFSLISVCCAVPAQKSDI